MATRIKKPTALGCYIFAGGFSLGVRKHFQLLAHFEEGPYGTETAQHNIPELRGHVYTDPGSWPVEDYRPDFVYGNPPCAPWSAGSHGRAVPWRLDPRTGCAQRLYALVDRMRPKVWAWESVRPAFTKGREMVDGFVSNMPKGYTATALLVEGTRHGVPQRRPRFFLVLSQYDVPWAPTRFAGTATVGAALKGVSDKPRKDFPERIAKWASCIEEGGSARKVFEKQFPKIVAKAEAAGENVPGRPQFLCRRLRRDEPSYVVTGGTQHIHFSKDRWLSVPESAALCGYPPSFEFKGHLGGQYAQIAQAVMPPVGEYIARMAAAAIKAKKPGPGGFEQVEIFQEEVQRQQLIVLPKGKTVSLPPPAAKPAKEQKAAAPGRPGPAGPRKLGSGFRMRQMLVKGMQSSAILAVIHKEFPDSKATNSDVGWNRAKLQKQGGVP